MRTAEPLDLRDLVRKPLAPVLTTVAGSAAMSSVSQHVARPVETDQGLVLLDEMVRLVPAMAERIAQLEAQVCHIQDISQAEVQAAASLASQWQGAAEAGARQLEELEKENAAMRIQAAAAEATIATLRGESERSQYAATEADALVAQFREKVLAAFGASSALHPILESFRQQTTL